MSHPGHSHVPYLPPHIRACSYMRDIGLLSSIVPLLQHSNVKLLTRAVGVSHPRTARVCAHHEPRSAQVVHNMSSDSSSIASIRHEQALPMLINLLKVALVLRACFPGCLQAQLLFLYLTRRAGPAARHLRQRGRCSAKHVEGAPFLRHYQVLCCNVYSFESFGYIFFYRLCYVAVLFVALP